MSVGKILFTRHFFTDRFTASLLMLAVVTRPSLNLSISDLVRMFNSEALSWFNSASLIPQSLSLAGDEKQRFR